MNWLTSALSSSVGRKYVMALTGLFLCLFLVIHLAGNLLLYVGPDAYNEYAHALHEQKVFLFISQVLLYAAFLVHIYVAFVLTTSNVAARFTPYAKRVSKRTDRLATEVIAPEAWMFRSGAIVLLFLIIHVSDFKFEFGWDFQALLGGTASGGEVSEFSRYERAGVILRDFGRAIIYTLGSVVLGVHVSHGLASACQSLGINHPRYNRCLRWTSIIFGWIVAVGFASFPVVWSLSPGAPVEEMVPVQNAPVELAPRENASPLPAGNRSQPGDAR